MRTRFSSVAAAIAVGAVFVAAPLAATAKNEKRVVITERMQLTSPTTQAGTFAAAGAVNDAGSGAATFTVTPAKNDTGHLVGTHVLTGAAGIITIETDATVAPFPPPTPPRAYAIGKWKIVSGTGAYAGIEGKGKIFATADFTNGQITIARVGKVKR